MSTDAPRLTKIGTEVLGVRVVSGAVSEAEPGSVILRQLYPGAPCDIGVVDSIEEGTGQTTIFPAHRRDWSDRDRLHLAEFFAARHTERCIADHKERHAAHHLDHADPTERFTAPSRTEPADD